MKEAGAPASRPRTAPAAAEPLDVLVIGAGFGGLAMAIRLRQRGAAFRLVEQAPAVGGTWQANRYPGAACDIPSHLYSLSFAPNADWTRRFPRQPEIAAYLQGLVPRFELAEHLRLGTRVIGLEWQPALQRWAAVLQSARGIERLQARVVVAATGGLSRPHEPALPGLPSFRGLRLHTARWPQGTDLAARRVGVVGSGASAVQLAPALASTGSTVTVFQRSAPWVLPRRDAPISAVQRWLCRRVPGWRLALRGLVYAAHEARAPAFVRHPRWLQALEPLALRHLHAQVPAGALRDALTPQDRMGCKRILISDDYYPALQRPGVRLVTAAIDRVLPEGVRTADGELHALDALVLATGFQAAESPPPFPVQGADGATLDGAWAGGPEAYLGSTVHGFPNLFLIVGPNTGLGHNSMVFVIESQVAYVLDALNRLRDERLASLDVKASAQDAFNAELQRRLQGTVWRTGCKSWYQTRDGRITTLWPGSTLEFRRRTRRLDPAAYAAVASAARADP